MHTVNCSPSVILRVRYIYIYISNTQDYGWTAILRIYITRTRKITDGLQSIRNISRTRKITDGLQFTVCTTLQKILIIVYLALLVVLIVVNVYIFYILVRLIRTLCFTDCLQRTFIWNRYWNMSRKRDSLITCDFKPNAYCSDNK